MATVKQKVERKESASADSSTSAFSAAARTGNANATSGAAPGTLGTTVLPGNATAQYIGKESSGMDFNEYYNKVSEANAQGKKTSTLGGIQSNTEESKTKEANVFDRAARAVQTIGESFSQAANEPFQKSLEENGAFNPQTIGAFALSLPTGMMAAPWEGVGQGYEAATGRDITNANTTGEIGELTPEQRIGSAINFGVNTLGVAVGGSGEFARAAARGVGTAAKAAKGSFNTEKFIGKQAEKLVSGEKKGGVIERGLKELKDSNVMKSKPARLATRYGMGTFEEGAEEWVQSYADDMRNETLDDTSLQRANEAFGWGALGGAMFEGAASAMNVGLDKINKKISPTSAAPIVDTNNDAGKKYYTDFSESYVPTAEEYYRDNSAHAVNQGTFSAVQAADPSIKFDDTKIAFGSFAAMINASDDTAVQAWASRLGLENNANGVTQLKDMINNADIAGLNNLIATNNNGRVAIGVIQDPRTSKRREMTFFLTGFTDANAGIYFNPIAASFKGIDVDGDQKRIDLTPINARQADGTEHFKLPSQDLFSMENPELNDASWENMASFGRALEDRGSYTTAYVKQLVADAFTTYTDRTATEKEVNDLSNKLISGLNQNASLTARGQRNNLLGEALTDIRNRVNETADPTRARVDGQQVAGNDAVSSILGSLAQKNITDDVVFQDIIGHMDQECQDLMNMRLLDSDVNVNEARGAKIEDVSAIEAKCLRGDIDKNAAETMATLSTYLGLNTSLAKARTGDVTYRQDQQLYFSIKQRDAYVDALSRIPSDAGSSLNATLARIYNIRAFGEKTRSTIAGLIMAKVQQDTMAQFEAKNGTGNTRIHPGDSSDEAIKSFKDVFKEVYNSQVKAFQEALDKVNQDVKVVDVTEMKEIRTDKDFDAAFMKMYRDTPLREVFSLDEDSSLNCFTFGSIIQYLNETGGYTGEFEMFGKDVQNFFQDLLDNDVNTDTQIDTRVKNQIQDIAETHLLQEPPNIEDEQIRAWLQSENYLAALYKLDSIARIIGDKALIFNDGALLTDALAAGWGYRALNGNVDELTHLIFTLSIRGKFAAFLSTRQALIDENPDMTLEEIYEDENFSRQLDEAMKESVDGSFFSQTVLANWAGETETGAHLHNTQWLDLCCDLNNTSSWSDFETQWNQLQKERKYQEPLLTQALRSGDERLVNSELSDRLVRSQSSLRTSQQNNYDACNEQQERFFRFLDSRLSTNERLQGTVMERLANRCYQMMNMQNTQLLGSCIADQLYESSSNSQKGQTNPSEDLHAQQMIYALQGGLTSWLEFEDMQNGNTYTEAQFANNRLAQMAVLFGGARVQLFNGNCTWTVDAQTMLNEATDPDQTPTEVENGQLNYEQFKTIVRANPTMITWLGSPVLGDTNMSTPVGKLGFADDLKTQFSDFVALENQPGKNGVADAIANSRIGWSLLNYSGYYAILAGSVNPEIIERGSREEIRREVMNAHEEWIRYFAARNTALKSRYQNQTLSTTDIEQGFREANANAISSVSPLLRSVADLSSYSASASTSISSTLQDVADSLGNAVRFNMNAETTAEFRNRLQEFRKSGLNNIEQDELRQFSNELVDQIIRAERQGGTLNETNDLLNRAVADTQIISTVMIGEDALVNQIMNSSMFEGFDQDEATLLRDNFRRSLRKAITNLSRNSDFNLVGNLSTIDLIYDDDINPIREALNEFNNLYINQNLNINNLNRSLRQAQDALGVIRYKLERIAGNAYIGTNGELVTAETSFENVEDMLDTFEGYIQDCQAHLTDPGHNPLPVIQGIPAITAMLMSCKTNINNTVNVQVFNHLAGMSDPYLDVNALTNSAVIGDYVNEILFHPCRGILQDERIPAGTRAMTDEQMPSMPKTYFGDKRSGYFAIHSQLGANVGRIATSIGMDGMGITNQYLGLHALPKDSVCNADPDPDLSCSLADANFANLEGHMIEISQNQGDGPYIYATARDLARAQRSHAGDPSWQVYVYPVEHCHNNGWCSKCNSFNRTSNVITQILNFTQEDLVLRLKKSLGNINWLYDEVNFDYEPNVVDFDPNTILEEISDFRDRAAQTLFADLTHAGLDSLTLSDVYSFTQFLTPAFKTTLNDGGDHVMLSYEDIINMTQGNIPTDPNSPVARAASAAHCQIELAVMPLEQISQKIQYEICNDPDVARQVCGRLNRNFDITGHIQDIAARAYSDWSNYTYDGNTATSQRTLSTLQRGKSLSATQVNPLSSISNPTLDQAYLSSEDIVRTHMRYSKRTAFESAGRDQAGLTELMNTDRHVFNDPRGEHAIATNSSLNTNSSFVISDIVTPDERGFNFYTNKESEESRAGQRDFDAIANSDNAGKRKFRRADQKSSFKEEMFVIATNNSDNVMKLLKDEHSNVYGHDYVAIPVDTAEKCEELSAQNIGHETTISIGDVPFNVYEINRIWDQNFNGWQSHMTDTVVRLNNTLHAVADINVIEDMADAGMRFNSDWAKSLSPVRIQDDYELNPIAAAINNGAGRINPSDYYVLYRDNLEEHYREVTSGLTDDLESKEVNDYFAENIIWPDNVKIGGASSDLSEKTARKLWLDFLQNTQDLSWSGITCSDVSVANLNIIGAVQINDAYGGNPKIMPLIFRSNSEIPTNNHTFNPDWRDYNGTLTIKHNSTYDISQDPASVLMKIYDGEGKATASQLTAEEEQIAYQLPIMLGDDRFNRVIFSNLATVKNRASGSVGKMATNSMDALARLLPSSLRYTQNEDGQWGLNENINPRLINEHVAPDDETSPTLLDSLFQKDSNSRVWKKIIDGEINFFERDGGWKNASDAEYFRGINEAIRFIARRGYKTGVRLGAFFEPHQFSYDQNGNPTNPVPMQSANAELMSLLANTQLAQVANLYNQMNPRIIERINSDDSYRNDRDVADPQNAPLLRLSGTQCGQPFLQILMTSPSENGRGVYVQGHYEYDHLDEHQNYLGSASNNYRTNPQHPFFLSMENGIGNTDQALDLLDLMFVNQGQSLNGKRAGSEYGSNDWVVRQGDITRRLLGESNFALSPTARMVNNHVGIADFMANEYYTEQIKRQGETFRQQNLTFYNTTEKEVQDITKVADYDTLKDQLRDALGMTDLTDSLFQNIFKLAYGYTNDNFHDCEFNIPEGDFKAVINNVISNVKNINNGNYIISGGYVNNISAKAGSDQERFSFPLGEKEMMRTLYENSSVLKGHYQNNGGFDEFIKDGQAQTRQSMDLVRNIQTQTGSRGYRQSNKKAAYNYMFDYLLRDHGMSTMSGHLWQNFYFSDIEQNDALLKNMLYSDAQKAELETYRQQYAEGEERMRRLAERNAAATTLTVTNDVANQNTTREGTVTQVSRSLLPHRSRLARNMTTLLKINQMAEPMIAVANAAEGFVRTGLMRAQLNLPGGRRGDRQSVCSDDISGQAAQSLELRQLFDPLSKAHLLGKMDELMAGFNEHYAAGDLDDFVNSLYGDQTRFQQLGDRFFRKMSCDKLYLQTKLDMSIKYFALLCEQNGIVSQTSTEIGPDGNTQTMMEMQLTNDPRAWLEHVLSSPDTAPYFLQAMNMAEKVSMSQENVISCLADYAFDHTRFGGAAKFLISGTFTPFYRYKLNQIGKLASCVLPVSTMHYLAVDLLSETKLGERAGIDRVQMHARLFDAMLSDAMHFTIPVCAAILASLTGALGAALQPPEDKDKEWDYREWTLFGERIGEVWWIQDIMGMAMPMACWFASCQDGNPNMAILVKGFETQVSINPMLNPWDTIDMLMNDDIESDYGLEGQVDATGAEPDAWDLVRTNFMTTGLSFLGRYITPSLVREISQSYNYEKSYKRVFTDDALAEGSINPENGQSGSTRKVDYTEAQIRKITRNNYILATIMDLFNPNATTSYGATGTLFNSQGMPNVEYYNQEYLYYQNKYSIYDEGGNLKSQSQCDQVALDIITTLEQYDKDDMDTLYNQGFAIDSDTRSYVSTVLSQMIKDSNTEFYDWYNSAEGSWKTLGDGDYDTGIAIRQEAYDEHQALVDHWKELYYDKLWSDELLQGVPTYFSENTTYRQTSQGDIYASGDLRGLATSLNLPFYGLETENTLGAEGDWQTPDPRNGESLGRRALVAKENDYVKTPDIDSWTEDTEDTSTKDNTNNNGGGGGWTNYPSYSRGRSGYSRSGGGYSRSSGGGYSSSTKMPSIYSNVNRLSPDRATTMNTSRIYDPNYAYIRPNFETKGSREASKRSDF